VIVCSDEDFDSRILAALRRRWPDFEYERAVDVSLGGRSDSDVLDWAARERRLLLTQDAKTMPKQALERLRKGLAMPGVVVVPQSLPLGQAIDELEIVLRLSGPEELENRVLRLPL
jgi:hypothetical protein